MLIRKLHKTDLPKLIIIEELSHSVPWSEEAFQHCLNARYPGWVLELEGKMIGFIIMTLQAEESHILNITIDRRYQRKGYGKQLLAYGLKEVQKGGAVIAYLEVRASNTRAIKLYENMGFIQIGVRKDYYPVPTGKEDALVFAKDLFVK